MYPGVGLSALMGGDCLGARKCARDGMGAPYLRQRKASAMDGETILRSLLPGVFVAFDRRNAHNLIMAASACVAGRRFMLMALARHGPGRRGLSRALTT